MIPDSSIKKIYNPNYDDSVEADNRLIGPFNIETNDTDNINTPMLHSLNIDFDYLNDTFDSRSMNDFGQNTFDTQADYNKYLYKSLRNGFNSGKETVKVKNNALVNNGFTHIANGMVFSLKQNYKTSADGYKDIDIDFSIKQKFYTKEVYNQSDYAKNMNEVENLIRKSY